MPPLARALTARGKRPEKRDPGPSDSKIFVISFIGLRLAGTSRLSVLSTSRSVLIIIRVRPTSSCVVGRVRVRFVRIIEKYMGEMKGEMEEIEVDY